MYQLNKLKKKIVVARKVCSKCRKEKQSADFPKRVSSLDGLHYHCNKCNAKATAQWRSANPAGWKVIMRRCYRKNPEKRIQDAYAWKKKNPDKYRVICRIATKKWKKANPKKAKEWRILNKERVRIRARLLYQKNPEKYRAYSRKYSKTPNGVLANAKNHALRRARERKMESTLTLDEWVSIKRLQQWKCAYCKKRKKLTLEHILPVTRGGNHVKENVRALCATCNGSKNNKTHEEYLEYLKLLKR